MADEPNSDELYSDDYHECRILDGNVALVARTALVPETDRAATFIRSQQACIAAYRAQSTKRVTSLIMDLSKARGNNDPDFERAMGQQLFKLLSVFDRIVFVVGSEVGALQLKRLLSDVDGATVERSVPAAIKFLAD